MFKIGKQCEENAKNNIFYYKKYKIAKFGNISDKNVLNRYILLQNYRKLLKVVNFVNKMQKGISYK